MVMSRYAIDVSKKESLSNRCSQTFNNKHQNPLNISTRFLTN